MSKPEMHRVFNNTIDLGARSEADKLLVNRIADIEAEIERQMTQVRVCTKFNDNDNLQKISNISEQIGDNVKQLERLSVKLHRLRHAETLFSFYDVCPEPSHRNVMIANESDRESVEDQNIIEKERRIARKVANGEDIIEFDNAPSLKMVCAHPRNVHDIAEDLRYNHTVRGWFAPRQTSCSCHGSSVGHSYGHGSGKKRKAEVNNVIVEGEPLSKIGTADKPVTIPILPRND